jgi:hypothetical protein
MIHIQINQLKELVWYWMKNQQNKHKLIKQMQKEPVK